VEGVRSLGCFPLFFGTILQQVTDVDPLDDEDFVLDVNLAFAF
jgi:hypothetical protein